MSRGNIIYHYPLPFGAPTSGSQVHLAQMLRAFRDLGYEVELVTGLPQERGEAMRRVRQDVAEGRRFDFLYAWSPTTPTLFAPPNRRHPLMDAAFFRWCRRHSIPVGLFYGDVHYRFDHYVQNVSRRLRRRMLPLFWYDWQVYRMTVDHLFLPSLRMADYLLSDWPRGRMSPLMPGAFCVDLPGHDRLPGDPVNLFYVGGIVPPLYDLKPLIDVVRSLPGVRLTLCCREAEWSEWRDYYGPVDGGQVRVVHASGAGLEPYYAQADVFAAFWRHPYLGITLPVKLFEALGHGLPSIVAGGTEMARFVTEEGTGWVADTDAELRALLTSFTSEPGAVAERRGRAEAVRGRHAWQARAQMVAGVLTR